VAVTLGFWEASLTRWEGGFGIGVGGVVALTTRPLQRRESTGCPGPSVRQRASSLFFQSGKVDCGDAFSATVGRLHWKCGLRFFPLHTDPVVRRVVSPATTALVLIPRGTATTGEVGAPTRDTLGCVNTVSLRVSKSLSALEMQRDFRGHVRFHRHSQAAEFGE
jgi:hypothetical protein